MVAAGMRPRPWNAAKVEEWAGHLRVAQHPLFAELADDPARITRIIHIQ
jgi:hypothetical protein